VLAVVLLLLMIVVVAGFTMPVNVLLPFFKNKTRNGTTTASTTKTMAKNTPSLSLSLFSVRFKHRRLPSDVTFVVFVDYFM
jgi:hypothetical protein